MYNNLIRTKTRIKTPQVELAGIASKGQCNLVYIMVPSEVTSRERFHERKEKGDKYSA